jgi:Mn2+/Fe2+ NRAMP family transporter
VARRNERASAHGKEVLGVVAVAMFTGMAMDYVGLDAIKMLFWSAVLNGVLAPPLIVIILIVCNNRRVMGEHVNGKLINALGIIAAILMSGAALAMLIVWTSSWLKY